MSTLIQLKRGTKEALYSIVPEVAEPVWAIDTKQLFVGDGVTPGGVLAGGSGGTNTFPTFWYNTSFTAQIGGLYAIDTTQGVVTITLPSNPSIGNQIRIVDAKDKFPTNKVVINPNGRRVNEGYGNYDITNNGCYIIY